MPFVNRERELGEIRRAIASRRSELIIVYGRRGVGKSTLLVKALRGQPHFFYQATTRTMSLQLDDLTSAFHAFVPDATITGALASIDTLLGLFAQLARARAPAPLVVVIDELPYLAQADPAIPTILQRWWDGIRQEGMTNLKVFLLGSLVSWMEEQTLSERGPLHHRRTGQIRIDPMGYGDAALFYPNYDPIERVSAYAIWGGMPTYLDEIDPTLPIWQNVRERVLEPGTRLADEPAWLRFSELRNDAIYSSLLRAIAHRNHRPGRIAEAVGRKRADEIFHQLDRLVDQRLIWREVPIHERDRLRSGLSLYQVSDHYVAFWYRFVDPARQLLALERFDSVLASIRDHFDQYIAESVFEDVARQYLWRALARNLLPVKLEFNAVGSWWAARDDLQDQIDVVALHDGHAVAVGECKWSTQPVDHHTLGGLNAALHKATPDLHPIDRPWRILFSRSGFTEAVKTLATDPEERVLLITPPDLYA